jgi:hypothetical protein
MPPNSKYSVVQVTLADGSLKYQLAQPDTVVDQADNLHGALTRMGFEIKDVSCIEINYEEALQLKLIQELDTIQHEPGRIK